MRKIIFVLIAALVVSISLTGSVESQSLKKAKQKITKKTEKKKAPAAASVNVLPKGLQLSWCGDDVKENGLIKIEALKNSIAIPVKNGKFDLVLPSNPVFGDEQDLYYAVRAEVDYDFGSAKIYILNAVNFINKSPKPNYVMGRKAEGRGNMGFDIYYSDRDVTGTVQGNPVTLKKGWNIVGDKDDSGVLLMCGG